MTSSNNTKIIVALDYSDRVSALNVARKLSPELCALKVGKELFTAEGPAIVEALQQQGYRIFLDLKYHDIPNTVAKACIAAANLGVWMLNVHALGGLKMMEAARHAIDSLSGEKPLLIAVTVLTSAVSTDLQDIGINQPLETVVLNLAALAQRAGLDGVVCSSREIQSIRETCGSYFTLVTPGVRPDDYTIADDQSRVMTPQEAITAGSDYLVVGRPITQAPDPAVALLKICKSLNI